MPTTSTPTWNGRHNGILGDASAMANAADINQFLGTHGVKAIYPGNSILTPQGSGGTVWGQQLSTQDVSQPFTMSGTVIGRVVVPVLPVGNGADLLVSLCANASGVPGAVITQTRVPANWISQLAAVSGSGPSQFSPDLTATGNALALAQFNLLFTGANVPGTWPLPAGSDGSHVVGWNTTTNDDYLFLLGGTSSGSGAAQSTAFTVTITPTSISAAIPQPAMPTANTDGGAAVVTDPTSGDQSVFLAGGWGSTTGGSPSVTLVYGAQIDASTGSLSSWTAQVPLPTATAQPAVVSYNGYLYVIGGGTGPYLSIATPLNLVQYAQVQNGQVVSWSTTTPLPFPTIGVAAWALDGFLYVMAENLAGTITALWYAPINANGTLGAWIWGPAAPGLLPTPLIAGTSGIYGDGVGLSTGVSGPDYGWQLQGSPGDIAVIFLAPNGDGLWEYYAVNVATPPSTIAFGALALTPRISVPLPTTGLTNGTTYHILLQQVGGDVNDYLCTHLDTGVFPGNPTGLVSAQGAYTWSALTPSTTAVPLQIYDGVQQAPGQPLLHTWEDTGARITLFANATTPDLRLLGLCEATAMTTAQNANTGFETGTAPWTATGTSSFTQSSTQAYEGQFAARLVPTGAATQVYLTSEFLTCLPGQSITASTWVWCTNAVTTNFSMSVNWYTAGKVLISTTTTNVSIPAATWTQVSNQLTAVSAPSLAYFYTLQPMLSGTPAAGQVWYVDNTIGSPTFVGAQQSSVTQVLWPPSASYPPTAYPLVPTGTVTLA